MASYAIVADLTAFGVSQKKLESFGKDEISRAITGASDTMDSYLAQRFVLPLTVWKKDITRCCAIMAVYDLLSSRGYAPDNASDELFKNRYDDCITWLRDVGAGRATPQATDSSPTAAPGRAGSRAQMVSSSQRGWSSRGSSGRNGPFSSD